MLRCDSCGEPAARNFSTRSPGVRSTVEKHYCYVHATEANLLDLPLDTLQQVSEQTGYPVNGVAFVLETLVRATSINTAQEISLAVISSAKERFREFSHKVLSEWKIVDKPDIGRIVFALARAELLLETGTVSPEDFNSPFTLGDILESP